MAFTQAQLDSLDEAIAQGATKVSYGDKTVEYRSLEEMIKLRNFLAGQVNPSAPRRGGRIQARSSKGLLPCSSANADFCGSCGSSSGCLCG